MQFMSKNTKIISIAIAAVIFCAGLFLRLQKSNEVVRYGTIKNFSSSGSMKFYYYDIENGKILEDKNKSWFWGTLNDDLVKYVSDNQGAFFKITGKKERDDCGYIEGICLEDIEISAIEAIATSNFQIH